MNLNYLQETPATTYELQRLNEYKYPPRREAYWHEATRNMYTVQQDGTMWLVMKDGHLFMANHSKQSAEYIALTLNAAKTPAPSSEINSLDIEDMKDLKSDQSPL